MTPKIAEIDRQRRPTQEVRSLLLDAARELFAVKGYRETTTKEIAARAGVYEPQIFTNFKTKAQLFQTVVAAPFDDFADAYIRSWHEQGAASTPSDVVEGFVRGLMQLTELNRGLISDAISPASGTDKDLKRGVLRAIAAAVQRIHALDEGPHGWRFERPNATLAAVTGMVMSIVLLDDILFPECSPRPSRDALISETTHLILYGVSTTQR
jgi:AcrR family transcriptional regulator